MTEMKFQYPEPIPGGRVVFEIFNRGKIPHRLVVAPLPDDLPPVGDMLARDERFRITPVAGIPNHPPGGRATFAVNLAPGRYGMFCLAVDPDGKSHAKKGQFSEFRIEGDRTSPSPDAPGAGGALPQPGGAGGASPPGGAGAASPEPAGPGAASSPPAGGEDASPTPAPAPSPQPGGPPATRRLPRASPL